MQKGELVTIRLKEMGNMRLLLPGIIVDRKQSDSRAVYCVLAGGSTYWVTDNDLGPVELSIPGAIKSLQI